MIRTGFASLLILTACEAPDSQLVPPNTIVGDAIEQSLTNQAGDVLRGKELFSSRDDGHCILCHQVDELEDEFQGDVGPALTYVGDRLSVGQLRLRVVDYQLVQPGALMPSYYRIHDLHQVGETYSGETILSAQEIEDIVAFLATQKVERDDS